MDFIKSVITDLNKAGITDLYSGRFFSWCIRMDFIPANIREEIIDFKQTEEGQRFCIGLL